MFEIKLLEIKKNTSSEMKSTLDGVSSLAHTLQMKRLVNLNTQQQKLFEISIEERDTTLCQKSVECHQGPATNLIGVPEKTDGEELFEDTLFKEIGIMVSFAKIHFF